MHTLTVVFAYLISIFAGGLFAKWWVVYLRKSIDPTYVAKHARNWKLDWSIGLVERGTVTTLLIFAPTLTPLFIGGWVALKFAANWDKRDVGLDFNAQQDVARNRLTGLIGSAASIMVAVIAGVAANPNALKVWAEVAGK